MTAPPWFERLHSAVIHEVSPFRTALVTAHPDDEVLGAGTLLPAIGHNGLLLCLTDGSPMNLRDAHSAGAGSREEYAHIRRQEFETVMALAGIGIQRFKNFAFVDQETVFHLGEIVQSLTEALREFRPDLILTHAYEGGHPDHDSASFAVAAAAAILKKYGQKMDVAEFASYNAGPLGRSWSTDFLPHPGVYPFQIELSKEERSVKRQLMECYVSQKWILEVFPCHVESFRSAPPYDFAEPPHPGQLFYERLGWEVSGSSWRALAGQVLSELKLR